MTAQRWKAAALFVLLLASLVGCSCSSPQNPEPAPSLSKFGDRLPRPEPPRPPPPEPKGPLVEEVLDQGCSTDVVNGLSEQIIAEGNCMQPGAFERLPELGNVELDTAVFPYMRRAARDALVEAVQARERHALKINSMLRTVAQQYLLYDWYKRGRCGIKLAAVPGKSNHQGGLAVDVSPPHRWRSTLTRFGFRWMGKRDRWHFDFVGDKAKKEATEDLEGLDIQAFQRLWNRNHPEAPIAEDGAWGDSTERALRLAPAQGFAVGALCDAEDMEDLEDAAPR